MREPDRSTRVTRRIFLGRSATAVPAAAVAGLGISPEAAWAQEAANLKPHTMATLVRAARDIYPHDRFPDSIYIAAVAGYDKAAAEKKGREFWEGGVAGLDAEARKRFGAEYLSVPAEENRVAVLKAMEATPFFRKLRSDLVVSLYNQKAVWVKLGYEGASAEQGGYIKRGFDDIDWLPVA